MELEKKIKIRKDVHNGAIIRIPMEMTKLFDIHPGMQVLIRTNIKNKKIEILMEEE